MSAAPGRPRQARSEGRPVSRLRSRLAEAVVAQAVRAIERDGPLDDGQAMRAALAAHTDREQRLLERAWRLGEGLGLDREWARWRRLGGAVLLALVACVVLGAWGLAQTVLGEQRQVNAVAAFASLLGLHGLALLAWCLGLCLPSGWLPGHGGALGRLALSLTARLPLDRGPHAIELLRATTDTLGRARLASWAFGCLSHQIWALSFAVLLLNLSFAFSLTAYRLTWETTILTPEFFQQFVQATGWLPQQLGFAMPDAASLLHPDAAGADHRAWAWWLMGCVAVYGLGLRLLCAGLAWAMWRRGQSRLRLDLSDPYWRRLLARFEAMEPTQVIDIERRPPAAESSPRSGPPESASDAASDAGAAALIGFELPPELGWPPFAPAGTALIRNIAGSQQERVALLLALAQARPHRLLLVCHGPSSPDRGTARFMAEACAAAAEAGLLLVGRTGDADSARWHDWLQASALSQVALLTDPHAAQTWVQSR